MDLTHKAMDNSNVPPALPRRDATPLDLWAEVRITYDCISCCWHSVTSFKQDACVERGSK
jgi:hypothetical protein